MCVYASAFYSRRVCVRRREHAREREREGERERKNERERELERERKRERLFSCKVWILSFSKFITRATHIHIQKYVYVYKISVCTPWVCTQVNFALAPCECGLFSFFKVMTRATRIHMSKHIYMHIYIYRSIHFCTWALRSRKLFYCARCWV